MKRIEFNLDKDNKLKEERGIGFRDAIEEIAQGRIIEILENPNKKYKGQRLFVIKIKNYIYIVPFVEDEEKIFLKTVYPSRKYKKKYEKKL